ncbi:unnamed protein product [Amoebophrya sp. A25]|nr:unnamed protein product [Amoebophrya sp. A25]|eukprot:GSA25T00013413001.1
MYPILLVDGDYDDDATGDAVGRVGVFLLLKIHSSTSDEMKTPRPARKKDELPAPCKPPGKLADPSRWKSRTSQSIRPRRTFQPKKLKLPKKLLLNKEAPTNTRRIKRFKKHLRIAFHSDEKAAEDEDQHMSTYRRHGFPASHYRFWLDEAAKQNQEKGLAA